MATVLETLLERRGISRTTACLIHLLYSADVLSFQAVLSITETTEDLAYIFDSILITDQWDNSP